MKYDVILWDFDGTLADTGKDVWGSLEYAAGILGGRIKEEFRTDDSNLGKAMEEILKEIEPFPGEEQLGKFDELVRIHYRTQNQFPQTALYPGMKNLLSGLMETGVRSYIITQKPKEALERILANKGWEQYFAGWLSPDSFADGICTKDRLISRLLQEIDVKKGAVYIGDTYSDVTASRENGIDCIGVTYGDGDTVRLLAADPMYIAEDVEAVSKILKEGV